MLGQISGFRKNFEAKNFWKVPLKHRKSQDIIRFRQQGLFINLGFRSATP